MCCAGMPVSGVGTYHPSLSMAQDSSLESKGSCGRTLTHTPTLHNRVPVMVVFMPLPGGTYSLLTLKKEAPRWFPAPSVWERGVMQINTVKPPSH